MFKFKKKIHLGTTNRIYIYVVSIIVSIVRTINFGQIVSPPTLNIIIDPEMYCQYI